MVFLIRVVFLVALGVVGGLPVMASDIVGFVRVDCLGGTDASDTVFSVPFQKMGAVRASVDTINVQSGVAVLNVSSPIASVDQFTSQPHFVILRNGALVGRVFEVTANTAQSVTIQSGDGSLSQIASGDPFEVLSNWTLDSLFPPATQSTIHVSGGVLPNQRQTEVLFFDSTSDGISLSPERIFFLTAGGWKQATSGYPSAGDTVIQPGAAFVIRHPAGAADTEFISYSVVEQGAVALPLRAREVGHQDNILSLVRPVSSMLSEIDLEGAFVVSASGTPADRKDELYVIETGSGTINSFPTGRYFRTASGWFLDDGASIVDANSAVVPVGAALVIRKAPGSGGVQFWVNSARY